MSIVLEEGFWENTYGSLTPTQMAGELKRIARCIRLSKYKKGKWKPKKKRGKKMNKTNRGRDSTAKILAESRGAAST